MVQVHDKQFEVFLKNEVILHRIEDLCMELNAEFAEAEQPPVFLAILNGSFIFASEVIQRIKFDCEISFVKLRSYVGDQSSGTVTDVIGLEIDLEGRDVILLEDIVDTGKTLHHFLPQLKKFNTKSETILTLLIKPDAVQYDLPIKHAGFAVPNHFLIGFGLDYDGLGRNYKDIYKVVEGE
jgi:hypoxanthine phosphoribosyltransferase